VEYGSFGPSNEEYGPFGPRVAQGVNIGAVVDCLPNWYEAFSTYDLRAASSEARSLCSDDDAMDVVNAPRMATAVSAITINAMRTSTSVSPVSGRAATARRLHRVVKGVCWLD
jgi:hypothetical protein